MDRPLNRVSTFDFFSIFIPGAYFSIILLIVVPRMLSADYAILDLVGFSNLEAEGNKRPSIGAGSAVVLFFAFSIFSIITGSIFRAPTTGSLSLLSQWIQGSLSRVSQWIQESLSKVSRWILCLVRWFSQSKSKSKLCVESARNIALRNDAAEPEKEDDFPFLSSLVKIWRKYHATDEELPPDLVRIEEKKDEFLNKEWARNFEFNRWKSYVSLQESGLEAYARIRTSEARTRMFVGMIWACWLSIILILFAWAYKTTWPEEGHDSVLASLVGPIAASLWLGRLY